MRIGIAMIRQVLEHSDVVFVTLKRFHTFSHFLKGAIFCRLDGFRACFEDANDSKRGNASNALPALKKDRRDV